MGMYRLFLVQCILNCLLQVYTGVHKQGFIQPQNLANHDIVITTYETLRKEIDYVDLPHSNSKCVHAQVKDPRGKKAPDNDHVLITILVPYWVNVCCLL